LSFHFISLFSRRIYAAFLRRGIVLILIFFGGGLNYKSLNSRPANQRRANMPDYDRIFSSQTTNLT
jgi:hypothetical protein